MRATIFCVIFVIAALTVANSFEMNSIRRNHDNLVDSTTGNIARPKRDLDYHCGTHYGKGCTGLYSGFCCSSLGYCGLGPDYCSDGCQHQYGRCNI